MRFGIAWAVPVSMIFAPAMGRTTADSALPTVLPQVPLAPLPASKIKWVDPSTGVEQESFWAAIPEAQKRYLLPSADAFIQVSQVDNIGNISILPISASFKKGSYRLLFRWQQYRAEVCRPDKPDAGRILTGVALEIMADIKTSKAGVNIANLGALTGAAEREQVSGAIQIKQIGLGNSSPTLGTYLSNFSLTREGVTKALEAIAVTKAVLENDKNLLTPHYLAKTEATPGSCAIAEPAGATPIK